MNPKSHTLFHFTKNLDILKSVLSSGFWPRYCLEDVAWLGYKEFDYISYPMVCFCDIPLSRLDEHISFYGSFGLGMSRQWAERNGLNPVMYIAGQNELSKEIANINEHTNKLVDEDDKTLAKVTTRYILAHVKPTIGTMVVSGKPVEKLFYQESEWRYVPRSAEIEDYIYEEEHHDKDKLEQANQKTKKNCMLRFNLSDIKYIFVKSDAEIPEIMKFIQDGLDSFPLADLRILMSRVVSLESIHADL